MASVLATFSVLKDHVKLKVTEDTVGIDNMGNGNNKKKLLLFYWISTLALIMNNCCFINFIITIIGIIECYRFSIIGIISLFKY